MTREPLLERVKAMLAEGFGPRLKAVVLYGSEARGDSGPDSDIDVLVLLDGPLDEPSDSWACIEAVYPLVLESGRPIHAEPIDAAEYEAGEFPLYENAKREGVSL